MRWPIQRQLLLPVLSVVVLSIAVSSVANAWFIAARTREQQEESLARVVSTLTDAGFPLTSSVLKKMSGLSGAEFVLLDRAGNVEGSTIEFETADLQALTDVTTSSSVAGFSNNPILLLRGEQYLVGRLAVVGHAVGGPPTAQRSLLVLFPEEKWRLPARQALWLPLGAGAAAVLASVLVTTLLARRFVHPIQRLTRQAASVAQGEFSPAPLTPRDDEIRDLTISLNRMAEQLARYEDQVRRNERLRTLGQLGGGIAHQLRNSATGARLALELHEQECPLGSTCETLEVALRQLRLMETYLQRFLTLGRPTAAPRARVSMTELTSEVHALVRPSCVHTSLRLEVRLPSEPLEVLGDVDSLRLVLVNLLLNAIEAASRESTAPDGSGEVRVELSADGPRILLRVLDSGPGPAAKIRDQLFEPFTSDKPDGTGLGLSVARQVVEAHGGAIAWRREGAMTCFEVELPASPATSLAPADGSPAIRQPAADRPGTMLKTIP